MIKQEAKSIDEATFSNKIEISADIAAKIKQLRKTGFLKAALYAGAIGIVGIIACFGWGNTNAHAGQIATPQNTKQGVETYVAPGNGVHAINPNTGQTATFPLGGSVGYLPNGERIYKTLHQNNKPIQTNEDDTPPQNQGNNPPQNNAQTYSIDQLKKEIAKNPNNAKLYIQLADLQKTPEERIQTLEKALKQKGLVADDYEKAKIYHKIGYAYECIAENVGRKGDKEKQIEYNKQVLKYYILEYDISPIKDPNTKADIDALKKQGFNYFFNNILYRGLGSKGTFYSPQAKCFLIHPISISYNRYQNAGALLLWL